MSLKCCKSNYKSTYNKVPIYKFPKDLNEQKKWINNIPCIHFTVTKYSAFVTDHGKLRPVEPPSLFPNIVA